MSDLIASGATSFNGSNWEDLNRLIALAKFKFVVDDDYWIVVDGIRQTPDGEKRSAHLASQFSGAALDWVATTYATTPAVFNNFDGFVTATRQAFGVDDNNITALCQAKLGDLSWGTEVPSFFAELDRLFLALGISGHSTRVAHVMNKLPMEVRRQLADQGREFANYDTMRAWFNTRWALTPASVGKKAAVGKKPRCGNCGKKGHDATVCRSSKN